MQGPVIAEPPIVSIKVRKKIEAYKSDPSLSKFQDKQNEFHVNYARFRQLKSDLNQEDSRLLPIFKQTFDSRKTEPWN